MQLTQVSLKDAIADKLTKYYATTYQNATPLIMYKAVALVLRDILLKKKQDFNQQVRKTGSKRVYYLCMEFLIGRSLKNNLYNLGLTDIVEKIVNEAGMTLDQLYDMESDAGLGNGGLGRLAACFMDSLAWAFRYVTTTAFSSRKLWTTRRWNCPICGWIRAKCG